MEIGVARGDDGLRRCGWSVAAPDYAAYHDVNDHLAGCHVRAACERERRAVVSSPAGRQH
jgi:hypothetical protein